MKVQRTLGRASPQASRKRESSGSVAMPRLVPSEILWRTAGSAIAARVRSAILRRASGECVCLGFKANHPARVRQRLDQPMAGRPTQKYLMMEG